MWGFKKGSYVNHKPLIMTSNIKFKTKKIDLNLITEIPNYRKLWRHHVKCLPYLGEVGISEYTDEISEIMIYRDNDGLVKGVLQFFTENFAEERKGNLNIMVDPEHCKKRIGMKLLLLAAEKFDVNFEQQKYTPSGYKLLSKYNRSILKDS